ncbi:MAG TPA: hypothetical protein VMT34_02205, partial [Aggregatilineales bacterium]|nr:hypothetical protein [Aggregatilineales bacterium]
MRSPIPTFVRVMRRRTRSGQALLIIAAAFIALIAFVGIAVDVAMLFARFSTLRRAVDSAAIAAASHIHEGTNYETMQAIAVQFIKLHGIDPSSVKVETCETEVADFKATNASVPGINGQYSAFNTIVAFAVTPPPYDGVTKPYPSELCKASPLKIVRVSAQMQSSTTFLSLIGWRTVTLSTSSLSQTAVLDVALLLDSSLSEAEDTYSHMGIQASSSSYSGAYPCPQGISGTSNSICNGLSSRRATAWNDDTDPLYGSFQKRLADAAWLSTRGLTASNMAPLANFADLTNSPNPQLDNPPAKVLPLGLGLNPYGKDVDTADAVNTPPNPPSPGPDNIIDLSDPNEICFDNPTSPACRTQAPTAIRPECFVVRNGDYSARAANYAWAGCCNDPAIQSNDVNETNNGNSTGVDGAWGQNPDWYICDDPTNPIGESLIMADGNNYCSPKIAGNWGNSSKVVGTQTNDGTHPNNVTSTAYKNVAAAGFAYTSNADKANDKYVGGDGNYSDLICEPFKEIRDAARRFIRKLDFVRGDRVVIVNFDSETHVQRPWSGSPPVQQATPIITDKTQAIRTLNYLVGVEVNPTWYYSGCNTWQSNFNGSNPDVPGGGSRVYSYWTVAQCPDTNTGDGILAATNALTDPAYVRRESVWVMVLLSDGYPNRTTDRQNLPSGIGVTPSSSHPYLDVHARHADPMGTNAPSIVYNSDSTQVSSVCNPANTTTDPGFGMGAGYVNNFGYVICTNSASASGTNWFGAAGSVVGPATSPAAGIGDKGLVKPSYGFCPWWTFCNPNDATCKWQAGQYPGYGNRPDITNTLKAPNSPLGMWMYARYPGTPINYTPTDFRESPECAGEDPDARHFCSDQAGSINPPGVDQSKVFCDPHYDAIDYARDMADQAGLLQYTPTTPGDFIAMFTIFFAHHPDANNVPPIGSNILGIKFLRYMTD